MKGARARQEQLARERLQALKEKRQAAQQHKEEEDTPHAPLEDTDDVLKLQVCVLMCILTAGNHPISVYISVYS